MGVRVNMWGCYFILAISVLGVHGGPVQPGVINGFQENLTYFRERGFELGLSPLWRSECRVWSADEVYLEGDKVQYNGKYYQARWWTSGVAPAAGGTWGDWKLIGDTCNQDDDDNDKPDDNDDDNHDDNHDDHDDDNHDDDGPKPGEVPTKEQAEKREQELTDTPLFHMVKKSIATLDSQTVDAIKPGAAKNPHNVKRLEKLLSEKDWEYLFPDRNEEYTYRRFLQAVGKFPSVCGDYKDGRDADLICKKTLATMFAHFTQETGGHNPHGEVEQWRQGLVFLREAGCTETGPGCGYDSSCDPNTWQGKTWPCGTNGGGWKKYFGRGAKQLSYNFNYGPFSDAMYGTVKKLLENPDLVASTWLNLASATWFYSYPQPPKPSMFHVIDGTWQPNEADKKNKLEPGFGATIMIINGGIECGHGYEKPQATNRQEYYKNFAKFFKLDISGEELSCAHMSKFSKDGAGSLYIYWDREWTKEYQCQLVKYQTPFNALKKGDYVRCVEDQFNVKLK